jgi:predicted DNA-binding transcriptional regulator AlpA
MNKTAESIPEAAGGNGKSAALLDKRGVARLLQLSPRSVSNLMEKGMPHLRIGERRCRFVEADVLIWLRERFSCQRMGKLGVNGNGVRA